MKFEDCLTVGKILKPVGLKGIVKVISLSDFPERFFGFRKFYLYDERKKDFHANKKNESVNFVTRSCETAGDFYRIGFEGYDRIEDVEPLVGSLLLIDETERMPLPEGRYYYYDLVGLGVYEKGKHLGIIDAVVDYGSGDIFRVMREGKELLIPFKDEFVKEIDLKNRKVEVELIEGMD